MVKVSVSCPVCKIWDKIEISDNAIKNVEKGVLAVNITPGMICEHSFIAYVDKNLSVRDCFIADFKIEAPEISETQIEENRSKSDVEEINFDLIKLNIPETLMAYIFRAIFIGKKVIFISEDHFLGEQIIKFFKYTSQNHFEVKIKVMLKNEYLNDEGDYADHIVLERSEILHDDGRIIDPKKLSVEKGIARKFLKEYDPQTGLIILRNEVQKAYEYSKALIGFLRASNDQTIPSKNLIRFISEKYNDKIQGNYLNFLLDIAYKYFKAEIPNIDKSTKFLNFL